MKAKEEIVVTGLVLFLFTLWLGFFIHRDPRFAGSLLGGVFAVSGSALLLVPLFYSVVKRIPWLKRHVTRRVSLSKLLSIHIYTAILGAILVLIHTGHKFKGPLATGLTAVLLLEIASGYVGRYLLSHVLRDMSDQRRLSSALEIIYSNQVKAIEQHPDEVSLLKSVSGPFSKLFATYFFRKSLATDTLQRTRDILDLTESLADVEYAIRSHNVFKKLFSRWLKFHIVLSLIFYSLLFLHVTGEIYFGLRWFQ